MAWPKKPSADSIIVSDRVGWAWMVIARSVGDRRHLDRQHALGDHLAGAGADDADAEHALGLRVEDDLGQAVGAADRGGAARTRPTGTSALRTAMLSRFGLDLGQAAPGQLGIGEDDRGNRRAARRRPCGRRWPRRRSWLRRSPCARASARRRRRRWRRASARRCAAARRRSMKPLSSTSTLVFSRPGIVAVRAPADRHQHLLEDLLARGRRRCLEGDADAAVGSSAILATLVVSITDSQIWLDALGEDLDQVAIGAGQQARQSSRRPRPWCRAPRRPSPARGRCSRRRRPAATSGHSCSSSALVESSTRSALIVRFGSVAGREPVARMPTSKVTALPRRRSAPPTPCVGSTMVARPCT